MEALKKITGHLVTAIFFLMATAPAASAAPIDILVKKLEEKGILTHYEAQVILEETKQEVAKDMAEGKPAATATWAEKISLSGDVRYRNQIDWSDTSTTRYRQRVRARLAVKAKVNDEFSAAIRAVTGSTDPLSTNQTFNDFFGHKNLMIDWAYFKYTPGFLEKHVSAYAGVFPNPFFRTDQLLWDSDLTFEGAAIQAGINTKDLSALKRLPAADLFLNAGTFPLDDASGLKNPWLTGVQGGIGNNIYDGVDLKSALGFFFYNNVKDYPVTHRRNGNTNAFGRITPADGFDLINGESELSINDPLRFIGMEKSYIPSLKVYGGVVDNMATGTGAMGWLLGAKFGSKKVGDPGTWQLGYNYRQLGANCQLDVFPDSDFYSTGTGAYGHKVTAAYAIAKNAILDVNWYIDVRNRKVTGDYDKKQGLLQVDALVKF